MLIVEWTSAPYSNISGIQIAWTWVHTFKLDWRHMRQRLSTFAAQLDGQGDSNCAVATHGPCDVVVLWFSFCGIMIAIVDSSTIPLS